MQSFETSCGHFVKVIPVRSCGGTQEGRWQEVRHETLVMCRELQKRSLIGALVLSEQDAGLLLRCLYTGHCTSILTKYRNNGYYRRLSDEFQHYFPESTITDRQHDSGWDAYKCGRLLLHYNRAATTTTTDCETALLQVKRAKLSTSTI